MRCLLLMIVCFSSASSQFIPDWNCIIDGICERGIATAQAPHNLRPRNFPRGRMDGK